MPALEEDDEHHRPPAQPQGQEPQQPAALHRGRAPRSRRCDALRSASSATSSAARRSRSRRAASPSRCSATAGAAAATNTSCPATRSMSSATRSSGRSGGEGRRRKGARTGRAGRVRVRAVEGGVPRPVLRGSRTARPGQEEPARDAVDLQRAGYSVSGSPANLNIRRTMRNSLARRISLHRPKPSEIEALRAALAEARARDDEGEAQSALDLERAEAAPSSSPISTRSTSATTASSGCRSPIPRR